MAKAKTNSSAKKRFKANGAGYKHRKSNRNHILTKKPSKRKRRLRGLSQLAGDAQNQVKRMLG